MQRTESTIAVLSSSAALGSLLCATLRGEKGRRVRRFEDAASLRDYMRLAPVALLVADYGLEGQGLADFAIALRRDAGIVSRDVQILALSRTVEPSMQHACVAAGIDEVIVKPMSPRYLRERVAARLAKGGGDHIVTRSGYVGPERRGRLLQADPRPIAWERRETNVIPFLAPGTLGQDGDPAAPLS